MEIFVEHYVNNKFNATQAAKDADYSPKTAYSSGQRLLKRVDVQEAIQKRIRALLSETEKLTLQWLEETKKVAFSDIRKALNDDGSPKDVSTLDDDIAGAVEGISTCTVTKISDRGEEEKITTNVKLSSKTKGLELLGKYLAILSDAPPESRDSKEEVSREEAKERLAYLLKKRDS